MNDEPFVIDETRRSAMLRRIDAQQMRRHRRRTVYAMVLAVILLAVLVVLAVRADRTTQDAAVNVPAYTESPEIEESTIHYSAPDWDELMVRAVLDGDEQLGADCVERGGLSYTYDDLYLLAKIIREEDGADGDGHEWPDLPILAIANVVLHRVRSPLFPNTVREVIYQEGPGSTVQYAPVHASRWEETEPVERYVRLAQRALNGEEVIGEEVIYQALFPQGSMTVMTWYDEYLGTTTYFCRG